MGDWRLHGQEEYLKGEVLYKVNFPDFWKKAYAEKNAFYRAIAAEAHNFVKITHRGEEYLEGEKIQHFWHEHCDFCSDKAMTDIPCEFYCTKDMKYWICKECFNDFKDRFDWIKKSSDELID